MNTLQNIKRAGRKEGKKEGRIEGKIEGKVEGKVEGKIEGKAEGKVEVATRLLLKFPEWPDTLVSEITGLPVEKVKEIRLLFKTA